MRHSATQPFAVLVQKFFMQRLQQQRHASPCTVTAYRDSFRLLLAFAYQRLHKRPSDITIEDLDAPFILDFLRYLEQDRRNSIRSRNARFAAVRSFMEYVSFEEPSAMAIAQSVLAIPMKRFEQPLVGFLSREHIEAILAAPDTGTWTGQRDHIMLATLYNTGARVSELIDMRVSDLVLGPTSWIRIHGKGRKERSVPLWPDTAKDLERWLRQYPRAPQEPLFPGRSGAPLTRIGFTDRLKLATQIASRQFPELRPASDFSAPRSPFRCHAHAAVGRSRCSHRAVARHESPATTHRYVEADLQMKERALKEFQAPSREPLRYRPKDDPFGSWRPYSY